MQVHGQVYAEAPIASPSPPNDIDNIGELLPSEIEFFISDNPQANLAALWPRLGIRHLNFAEDWPGRTTTSDFLVQCVGCTAESFEYDLDDESGSEVLLRIEDRLSESCRYLIFKSPYRSSSWKFVGHIDHDFGRYRMPQHMVLLSNGRTWLLVKGQAQSGTGVALYFDRLFLVDHGILKEVMRYTSEGHQSMFAYQPEREFSSRIVNANVEDGIARIQIEFVVTYLMEDLSNPAQPTSLFTKRQRALFVRQLDRKVFALDTTHSDFSQNELEAVYDIDSLTNEAFLKYNFEELSQVATGTDANKREWLKRLLNICKNSAEKRRLRALLKSN